MSGGVEVGLDLRAGRCRARKQRGCPEVGAYLCMLLLICSQVCANAAEPVAISGRAMGTTWMVKFHPPTKPLALPVVAERVGRRLDELEQQFSTYRPTSDISRFNATAGRVGEWISVPGEVAQMVALARELSAATEGAFDATVDPLVRLWGFGPTQRAGVPDLDEIRSARAVVGWRAIEVRTTEAALRRLKPGVTIDLSSVAKGFAADEISAVLVGLGAVSHLVQVGGDMKARGGGGDGRSWAVGIESPNENQSEIAATVELQDHALSTSGDYRNYFIEGERRYGHIIDPRTGTPVEGDLAAVSVVAPSGARASGLATALFVLGAERGLAFARAERLACSFFVREPNGTFSRWATPEFERLTRATKSR